MAAPTAGGAPLRVLVLGAGTGPAGNLVRSLRAGMPAVVVAGAHHDRFVLAAAPMTARFLLPRPDDPGFIDALLPVVDEVAADVVVPTTDAEVSALAGARVRLGRRVFLPDDRALARCADKADLAAHLAAGGLPVPRTVALGPGTSPREAFDRVSTRGRAWCRIRRGSGSAGALPVTGAGQIEAWVRYWEAMRDVPPGSFALSEYLPGRDVTCQMLWRDGEAVLVKAFERLDYISVGGNPSGVSSAASLARTVTDPEVAAVATQAVRAVDPRARGVFAVDLKGNDADVLCVTEINAGRFLAGTPLLDLTGRHNMVSTYVRLAQGEAVAPVPGIDAPSEEHYMVRGVDAAPVVLAAEEFFVRVQDRRK